METKKDNKSKWELRPYQKEAVETVNNLPDGSRSIVCLATGLGKTVTAANFDFKGRVLWISHRDELVRQPERYFTSRGLTFGIEKANEYSDGTEDVVSASIQTISKPGRLSRFKPDDFACIIVDEAQHCAAPSYRATLSYFKPKKLIGLTATPKRGDKVRLTDTFDSICFTRDLRWGIENGYLARIRCVQVRSNYDMNRMKKQLGDFTASDLEREMKDSDDDFIVTKAYQEYSLPEKKQTLVYCPTKKVCYFVAKTMKASVGKEEAKKIAVLSDETSPEDRAKMLQDFRDKKIRCIINCMILTEGTDLPDVSVIINNRPSANSSLYQQIVGRGTRKAEGKEFCLVVDVIGDNYKQKDICTAPTLFGLDPDFMSPEMKKDMENKDLLTFSNRFARERASELESIKLEEEMIDFFTQTRIGLINDHKEEGFKAIAKAYNDSLNDAVEEDIAEEFGDILVKRQPSDEHYYQIDATFSGKIFLSRPDMLGNTTVEFCCPDVEVPNADHSEYMYLEGMTPQMPFKDAITLVHNVLTYVIPEHYAMKWSKDRRHEEDGSPATERQCDRIESVYRHFGVVDDSVTNGFIEGLTKREASDLIDMERELASLGKERLSCEDKIRKAEKKASIGIIKDEDQDLTAREKRKKKTDAVRQIKTAKEEEKKRKAEVETLKERYGQLKVYIDTIMKKSSSVCESKSLHIRINPTYFSQNQPISEKQIEYAKKLYTQNDARGKHHNVAIEDYASACGDKWHFGMVIDLENEIKKTPLPKNEEYIFDIFTFMEEIREIKSRSDCKTVECKFRVL